MRDRINFKARAGVRSICARGIALREEGYGGDGLQPSGRVGAASLGG